MWVWNTLQEHADFIASCFFSSFSLVSSSKSASTLYLKIKYNNKKKICLVCVDAPGPQTLNASWRLPAVGKCALVFSYSQGSKVTQLQIYEGMRLWSSSYTCHTVKTESVSKAFQELYGYCLGLFRRASGSLLRIQFQKQEAIKVVFSNIFSYHAFS